MNPQDTGKIKQMGGARIPRRTGGGDGRFSFIFVQGVLEDMALLLGRSIAIGSPDILTGAIDFLAGSDVCTEHSPAICASRFMMPAAILIYQLYATSFHASHYVLCMLLSLSLP